MLLHSQAGNRLEAIRRAMGAPEPHQGRDGRGAGHGVGTGASAGASAVAVIAQQLSRFGDVATLAAHLRRIVSSLSTRRSLPLAVSVLLLVLLLARRKM